MRNDDAGDRLIALFLLGVLALSPPLLAVFSSRLSVFGWPLLYAYLFGAWLALIALLALAGRGFRRGDERPPAVPPES